jgi:hypothetical protein
MFDITVLMKKSGRKQGTACKIVVTTTTTTTTIIIIIIML